MHKLLVQFYATPHELADFLRELLSLDLTLVTMELSPFLIQLASSKADLEVSRLQKASQVMVFHEPPVTSCENWNQFLDANRDGLFLWMGRLDQQVLSQSWLSAQSTSEQVIKRWRKVANILKRRTSAGVWIASLLNKDAGFYKQFRFTEGALKLFDEGCRIAPPAGNNLVFLRNPSPDC